MLHSPSAGKQLSLKAADSGIGVACEYEVKLTAACKSCFSQALRNRGISRTMIGKQITNGRSEWIGL